MVVVAARRIASVPAVHFNVLNRQVHYWAAALIAIPLIVIAVTGTILQLKKHWAWVQPIEQRGSTTTPVIELSGILEALKNDPSLKVSSWDDVKRLDVRPDRGVVKAWLQTDWEAQIDLGTGEILQVAYRRSDWIESIHDGSIFGDIVKLGLFFPAAIGLVLLWFGGMWMWVYPFIAKRRVRRRKAAAAERARPPAA
jgi:uncharacterized iron-regulated membrane protein